MYPLGRRTGHIARQRLPDNLRFVSVILPLVALLAGVYFWLWKHGTLFPPRLETSYSFGCDAQCRYMVQVLLPFVAPAAIVAALTNYIQNRPHGRFLMLAAGLIAAYGLTAVVEWATLH